MQELKIRGVSDGFPPRKAVMTPNDISFKLAVPGYCKEDIKAEVKDGRLRIFTTEEFNNGDCEPLPDGAKVLFNTLSEPRIFLFEYKLPDGLDYDNIESTFAKGFLNIKFNFIEKKRETISIAID